MSRGTNALPSQTGRITERQTPRIATSGALMMGVKRAVNPQLRSSVEPRRDDYVFEGYELEDALEIANGALEDDVIVLEEDGNTAKVKPFVRDELLKPLENYFFGRASQ